MRLTDRRRIKVGGGQQPDIYEGCVTLEFTETTDNHVRAITANNDNVLTYLENLIIDSVEITPAKNYKHTFGIGQHKIGWKFNSSVIYANVMIGVCPLADRTIDNALVTIPSNITEIKGLAMRGIPAYNPNRGVTCLAVVPPTADTNAVAGWGLIGTGDRYLRVPAGSVDAYKVADQWSSYASAIIAI